MTEKTIGYARSASALQGEQSISAQVQALKAAGCVEVYIDEATSGNGLNRPGLNQARAALQSGDTLKVMRLDRIARSHTDLITFATDLMRDAIILISVDEPDAAVLLVLDHALNYGPVLSSETPWLRKLAYRVGAFLVDLSRRGSIPSR